VTITPCSRGRYRTIPVTRAEYTAVLESPARLNDKNVEIDKNTMKA
jgi:hypothetical protein